MKTTRFRHGARFFLGSVLVAFLSLGVWVGLQIFFPSPPAKSFTLPSIPVDPMLGQAEIAAAADAFSPASSTRQDAAVAGIEPAVPTQRIGSTDSLRVLRDRLARDRENEEHLLALADALFANGQPTEAWERVARTGRLDDVRFVSRILRFGVEASRADETLVMLDSVGDALPAFSDEDRLLLDRLHEKTRHVSRQATETEFPTVLATP